MQVHRQTDQRQHHLLRQHSRGDDASEDGTRLRKGRLRQRGPEDQRGRIHDPLRRSEVRLRHVRLSALRKDGDGLQDMQVPLLSLLRSAGKGKDNEERDGDAGGRPPPADGPLRPARSQASDEEIQGSDAGRPFPLRTAGSESPSVVARSRRNKEGRKKARLHRLPPHLRKEPLLEPPIFTSFSRSAT